MATCCRSAASSSAAAAAAPSRRRCDPACPVVATRGRRCCSLCPERQRGIGPRAVPGAPPCKHAFVRRPSGRPCCCARHIATRPVMQHTEIYGQTVEESKMQRREDIPFALGRGMPRAGATWCCCPSSKRNVQYVLQTARLGRVFPLHQLQPSWQCRVCRPRCRSFTAAPAARAGLGPGSRRQRPARSSCWPAAAAWWASAA